MWIAKPVSALSQAERSAWIATQAQLARAGSCEIPLSQTLAWARANEALGTVSYLVMNPEERIGGIVHAAGTSPRLQLECTNGPLLKWDDPVQIPRQFATFAYACSKLHPSFGALTLRPRWQQAELASRLKRLPIAPTSLHQASTLRIEVQASEESQRAGLDPRLQRSLKSSLRGGVRVEHWDACALGAGQIREFAESMRRFGQDRGFFVPGEEWFARLLNPSGTVESDLRFSLIRATAPGPAGAGWISTTLLVCTRNGIAHYLYGHEQRPEGARAAISPSAIAHFQALRQCAENGVRTYDLNGFTDPQDSTHPYSGVSRFKQQFGGEVLTFVSPEFRIAT